MMECVICKQGETKPGEATVTAHRNHCVVLIKGVPADVCVNCGEYYLSEQVALRVEEIVGLAGKDGSEIEVRSYAA